MQRGEWGNAQSTLHAALAGASETAPRLRQRVQAMLNICANHTHSSSGRTRRNTRSSLDPGTVCFHIIRNLETMHD